jgi:leucyl aminopeptidase (aminopeptidase T)
MRSSTQSQTILTVPCVLNDEEERSVQVRKRRGLVEMIESAAGALRSILRLQEKERMLVVVDDEKRSIGEAFVEAGEQLGAETSLYVVTGERPFSHVPGELRDQLPGKDVVINAFKGIPEEAPFRIALVKLETGVNARVGHGPSITEDMMTEGPMTADYERLCLTADRLMAAFKGVTRVRITAPGGTKIALDITGRDFQTDARIERGQMGNLPSGEIWCAPIENGADGTIVCDGSIGGLGQVPSPVTIRVSKGQIEWIGGDAKEFIERIEKLVHVDEMASVVGELGIGINPKARITGILLEDEKAGKTAHIAFGENKQMPGGMNDSKTHRDFLFHRPTIIAEHSDGTVHTLLSDGEIQV